MLLGREVDAPLDARGEAQAAALGAQLAAYRGLTINASPRRRTRQTAQAIALATGGSVAIAAQLDEVDFGAWCGRSFAELETEPRWREWNSRRATAATPGGDSMRAVQRRIVAYVESVGRAQSPGPGPIALVTHGENIRAALLHYLDIGLDDFLRVSVAPASAARLCFTSAAAPSVEQDVVRGQA